MLGREVVDAVLSDLESAPIAPGLRATLRLLQKLTLEPWNVAPEDVRVTQDAGVSDQAIADAIYVCVLFNIIVRAADALGVEPLSDDMFKRGAAYIVEQGYLPPNVAT